MIKLIPNPLLLATAAILALGVLPMPYGYYTLLRIVACVVFCWAALIVHKRNEKSEESTFWAFLVLGVVYNPILPIYLPKALWVLINIGSAIYIFSKSDQIVDEKSDEDY